MEKEDSINVANQVTTVFTGVVVAVAFTVCSGFVVVDMAGHSEMQLAAIR